MTWACGPYGRLPTSRPAAPLWFQKMDRNADGDLSRTEFFGPKAAFLKLDADGDGLVSVEEAARK